MDVQISQRNAPFAFREQHIASKGRRSQSKQLQQYFTLFNDARARYHSSVLSRSVETMLNAKNRPRISRVVSLGLGSLASSQNQGRRIKQLVILLEIAAQLQLSSPNDAEVAIYAQDPDFTKADEQFLRALGIQVLKTPSVSDLGEARRMIHNETLVYSPFLTIDGYQQLFTVVSNLEGLRSTMPVLIGDDFNALRMKWEKRTAEHRHVGEIIKGITEQKYQRRALAGEGFWEEADSPFPMAVYSRPSAAATGPTKARKSKL